MNLKSDFALLDIKKGRRKLLKAVGMTSAPTGQRIPITITGFIVGGWGGDDGVSREFQVDVTGVEVADAPNPAMSE